MTKEEFEQISWPEEFRVEFQSGSVQEFVSSQGVYWDDGDNNEGANENRPSISCCWKKKSPSQQKFRSIEFFVDEVVSIKSSESNVVWSTNV